MGKSSNFFGQPIYGQLIKSLDREKIVEVLRKSGCCKTAFYSFAAPAIIKMAYKPELFHNKFYWLGASMTDDIYAGMKLRLRHLLSFIDEHSPDGVYAYV